MEGMLQVAFELESSFYRGMRICAGIRLTWLWLKGGSAPWLPSRKAQKEAAASPPGPQTQGVGYSQPPYVCDC